MHSLFLFFIDGILNIPGNKFNINGYKKDNPKLDNVSVIRWIWEFL